MSKFRFKQFSVRNDTALKVGTDAVLLGAAMTLDVGAKRYLDIGAGTGVISLMVAQRQPEALIEAVEIDESASLTARFNYASSPWADRLKCYNVALQNFSPEAPYDHIFSNPPYYDSSLKNPEESKAVARHNDSLPLSALLCFASEHLGENGRLSLILPYDSKPRLIREAAGYGLYPFRLLAVKTTPGKAPRRLVAEFSFTRPSAAPHEDTLTLQDIKNFPGNKEGRTSEYLELTGAFYI